MMRIAKGLAAAAAVSLWASGASADWFVRGFGGPSFFEVPSGESSEVAATRFEPSYFEPSYETGTMIGGAVGMHRPEGWRIEGEVTYRRSQIDRLNASGAESGTNGWASTTTFMGNVFYEIGTRFSVRPYAGGGVGLLRASHEDVTVMGAVVAEDSSTEIAFQIGGGVAVDVVENIDITIDYRFMMANDPDFERLDAEYQDHSVIFGLRWRF